MTQFLIILGLSVFFILLAFIGLAIKTFFKKDAQLTTCSSGNSGCGCISQSSCSVEEK
ncbi:hypothetical protein ACT3CD_03955 [Geofilum sp. OHC36d9]|uniref:hypothetical protein n=1 Tax=Geofilum sp. OHC36d9 TaxID=3458413 RepID=UPI0040347894